jgi:hypothetical protein
MHLQRIVENGSRQASRKLLRFCRRCASHEDAAAHADGLADEAKLRLPNALLTAERLQARPASESLPSATDLRKRIHSLKLSHSHCGANGCRLLSFTGIEAVLAPLYFSR